MDTVQSEVMPRTDQTAENRRRILANLYNRWRSFQRPPTFAELAEEVDLAQGTVQHHIGVMRDEGLVHRKAVWLTASGHDAYVHECRPHMS